MNNQEKKKEVVTKQKIGIGAQVGIGIAVLAIIAAGGGLAAFFMVGEPATKTAETTTPPGAPGAFNLLAPVNRATDQDYTVVFDWTDSARATSYDVYIAVGGTFGTPTATITVSKYKDTTLKPGRGYSWKVVAKNAGGSTTSSTWTFATAGGSQWIQKLGYIPVDETISSACGGNRECDLDNILSCAEYDAVWLACHGISNRCPDNLAEQCEQMTICQCAGRSPGGPECTAYLADWTSPCE